MMCVHLALQPINRVSQGELHLLKATCDILYNRFRLIPGDMCSPTDQSKKLLSVHTLSCDGNEQDSGFRVHSSVRQ